MRGHFLDLLANIVFHVAERMEVHRCHGSRSCQLVEFRTHVLILERQHPAVGVIDDHELLRAEPVMRQNEGAQGILRDDATGITDNVSIACLQTQDLIHHQSGVHTSDHRQFPRWRERKMPQSKVLGKAVVRPEDFINDAHGFLSLSLL